MSAFLERGTEVCPGIRIRRKLASGAQWEIYRSTGESSVLAVSPQLYAAWTDGFQLPEGLFLPEDRFEDCRVFVAKKGYEIASLMQGPFPGTAGNIEAFSACYRSACQKGYFDGEHDAVYLEEYSLLLPTEDPGLKDDVLYGHWISGGINVEKESFGVIVRAMTWLPQELLLHFFDLAGYPGLELDDRDDGEKSFLSRADSEREPSLQQREEEKESLGKSSVSRGAIGREFTLPGRPGLEQFFRENILDVVINRERYERMGVSFPGATVLYGPPGTGKTFAVERLAEYLGWECFRIDSGSIGSSYIHETSRRISEVFGKAMKAAPSILVIDEMEAFLSERNSGPTGMHHMEEVAEFLRRIPEAVERGVLIFAMTNMLDSIDPAILRRGRFDHMIKVDYATKEEMRSFLEKRFSELPVAADVEIDSVAEGLAGRPMSDAAYVLKEAGRYAVRRDLPEIDKDCLRDALDLLPKKESKPRIGF